MKNILTVFLIFFTLQLVIGQTLSPVLKSHPGNNYKHLALVDTLLKEYENKG